MKMTNEAWLLLALGLLGSTSAPAAPQDALPEMARQRLAEVDANGDGAIDRAEAAANMPRLADQFDQLDANHDGRLTMAEVERAMQSRWTAADANHDGYIDKAEAQQAAMPRLAMLFDRIDAMATAGCRSRKCARWPRS